MPITKKTYRVEEAAQAANVCKRFLEMKIKSGDLAVIRLGRRCIRIREQDLDAWLAHNLVGGR